MGLLHRQASQLKTQKKRKFKSYNFDLQRHFNGNKPTIYDTVVCVLVIAQALPSTFLFAHISYPLPCALYFDVLLLSI